MTWYKVITSDFNLIFDGPEGATSLGLVSPPQPTKSFTSDIQFGLSLGSPDGRWFTETSRNTDTVKHAKVYQSSDEPNLFFIGFENLSAGGRLRLQ